MSNTSTIHIKTDFDCIVYDYGQELGTTKSDTYFNVELRIGEHELTFVFTEDESISKTVNYIVEDTDCDYRLNVEIAESICDKAKEYFDSENYSVAFALYSLAAEKGLAEAQNGLGNCYFSGHGVEKNHIRAVEWYLNAAEQGYAEAQWHLGFCYRFGSGVEQNLANAVAYFTKAAENGYALAQNLLGRFNEIGELINKDLIMAAKWYAKAAEQGLASAQHSLGRFYYNGIGVKKTS